MADVNCERSLNLEDAAASAVSTAAPRRRVGKAALAVLVVLNIVLWTMVVVTVSEAFRPAPFAKYPIA